MLQAKSRLRSLQVFVMVCIGLAPVGASAQLPAKHPFRHVIVVVQENRSIDNLFGSNSPTNAIYLPGLVSSTQALGYTITNGQKSTFSVQAVELPLPSLPGSPGSIDADDYDPSHTHTDWGRACDAPSITDPSNMCRMDGFNHVNVGCVQGTKNGCPGPQYPTYAYVGYSWVEPYFQIAADYGYANYMFQTNQGPSTSAHQFLFGGTSQPGLGPEPDWFVSENIIGTGNGCIADPNATIALVNPLTQDESLTMYPCFQHYTIADVFAAVKPQITWTYYTFSDNSKWTAPDSIQSLCTPVSGHCTGKYWTKGASNGFVDLNPSDVLTDIGKCNLAGVSWVIPTSLESDHSGSTDGSGPSWVASIVNAVGNQPKCPNGETYWYDTAILVTWDDSGGWYDTVTPPAPSPLAPPVASSYIYGFRVPLLVVSAYTPAGTVSNVMGLDFGSILKFIEENFHLAKIPPGQFADAYAYDDLAEFFNFSHPPRPFQKINAPLKADVFLDPKRPHGPPDTD